MKQRNSYSPELRERAVRLVPDQESAMFRPKASLRDHHQWWVYQARAAAKRLAVLNWRLGGIVIVAAGPLQPNDGRQMMGTTTEKLGLGEDNIPSKLRCEHNSSTIRTAVSNPMERKVGEFG